MLELFAKDHGLVKFVHVGEEYRFHHLNTDHDKQVKSGETAISAGFIKFVRHDKIVFRIMDRKSNTLSLGPMDGDGEAIAKLIDGEYVGMWYENGR